MLKKVLRENKGFTLIEIVLVIAIAAALILIVLLAVGGANRNRRDAQRKQDAQRYLAAAEQFASNNQGTYPTASIVAAYLTTGGGTFSDPQTGVAYTINTSVGTPALGQMNASTNATCTGGVMAASAGNARNFAVATFLESGGVFCVSNNN